jgi:cell division protein FtsQ
MLGLGLVAMLPWRALRREFAVVDRIRVSGLVYLDADRVRKASGIERGHDLFTLDLDAARAKLLRNPRLRDARVRRAGLRGVEIAVVERVPALVVPHGVPWEVDTAGVLLAPLQPGVVADVPMLTGVKASRLRPGDRISDPGLQRGLAWIALLSDNALRLAGQVSEVDVSDPQSTSFVLMNGTHVLAPAWPSGVRQLSALRVALADLERKGLRPGEIDVRFRDQVIVRSAQPVPAPTEGEPRTSG